MEKELLGVVLSGGESIRMGTDKGLLEAEGIRWVEKTFRLLTSLSIPTVVSINASQSEIYAQWIPQPCCVTDADIPVKGPLKGILSVMQKYRKDILVLACDMVAMHPSVVKQLIESYHTKEYQFYAFKNGAYFETTVAIYTREGLEQYLTGPITDYSLQRIVRNGNTFSIPVQQHQARFFKNYNRHSDIDFS